jgi:hypothetical protein
MPALLYGRGMCECGEENCDCDACEPVEIHRGGAQIMWDALNTLIKLHGPYMAKVFSQNQIECIQETLDEVSEELGGFVGYEETRPQ